MNCCGATGPGDYQFSVWTNHTRKGEGVFVPLTCCILRNDDPRHLVAFDYNQCQLDAILYDPASLSSATSSSLKTQARFVPYYILLLVENVSDRHVTVQTNYQEKLNEIQRFIHKKAKIGNSQLQNGNFLELATSTHGWWWGRGTWSA